MQHTAETVVNARKTLRLFTQHGNPDTRAFRQANSTPSSLRYFGSRGHKGTLLDESNRVFTHWCLELNLLPTLRFRNQAIRRPRHALSSQNS
jgi:hypothetical protein